MKKNLVPLLLIGCLGLSGCSIIKDLLNKFLSTSSSISSTSSVSSTSSSSSTSIYVPPTEDLTVNFVNFGGFTTGTQFGGASNQGNVDAFINAINLGDYEGFITSMNFVNAKFNDGSSAKNSDIYLTLGAAKSDGSISFSLATTINKVTVKAQRYHKYIAYNTSYNIDQNSSLKISSGIYSTQRELEVFSGTVNDEPSIETFELSFATKVSEFKIESYGAGGNGYNGTENDSARVFITEITFHLK